MRHRASSAMILVLPTLTACAGDSPPVRNAATVWDSAGIQMVENTGPAWEEGRGWRLAAEPSVRIGGPEGPPHVAFGYAHGAYRLSDGRLVVADRQTNLIHWYDSTGAHLMSAGGRGGGPGEFSQLYRMRKMPGDSLLALNPATLTSVFSPEGEFVRRFSFDMVPGRGNIWWNGYLGEGTFVALSLQREGTVEASPPADLPPNTEYARFQIPERPTFYRDTLLHFFYTPEGEFIDSVVKLPGQWLSQARIFPPNPAYAYGHDVWYHSPGDKVEIRTLRSLARAAPASGEEPRRLLRLERIVRRPPLHDISFTEARKEAYIEGERNRYRQLLDANPGIGIDLAAMERRWAEQEFPATIPAHGRLMFADPDSNLWLQEYDTAPEEAQQWSVFDAGGQWLGVVTTPARFTVTDIGNDHVVGLGRDDLDVQYLEVYPLIK